MQVRLVWTLISKKANYFWCLVLVPFKPYTAINIITYPWRLDLCLVNHALGSRHGHVLLHGWKVKEGWVKHAVGDIFDIGSSLFWNSFLIILRAPWLWTWSCYSTSLPSQEVDVGLTSMVWRMLSNRASAQRSRQRRQNRLDQLEVLVWSVPFLWELLPFFFGDRNCLFANWLWNVHNSTIQIPIWNCLDSCELISNTWMWLFCRLLN